MRNVALVLLAAVLAAGLGNTGCTRTGKLSLVQPVAPVSREGTPVGGHADSSRAVLQALFGSSSTGFEPGSGDSTKRFLGRLKSGFTVDTTNVIIVGDNRPAFRTIELTPYYTPIAQMISLNPIKWANGLIHIPVFLYKATFPDAKLWRDLPALITHKPTYGREHQVTTAMVAMVDSLQKRNQAVACVINTGDLVKDGRYPEFWQRFLRIVRPLSDRVPYFAVAGNHERTDTKLGMENWRTATGLPVAWDRLYYSFDTADGWIRIIALDSNPLVDPQHYWSRETEVKYSAEQIDWMGRMLDDHVGPAIVFLHHPPFAIGTHYSEWESDPVLRARRAQIIKVLEDHQLSVLASSHEHAYSRALLRCGDQVLVVLLSGGGGAPLYAVPVGKEAQQLMSRYKVEGCEFRPEDVFASRVFHFVLMRFWFGGGEFYTYAVDKNAKLTELDHVSIDLSRYGIPKVDQNKLPILEQKGPKERHPEDKPKESAPPDTAGKQLTPAGVPQPPQ